jgi:L-ascorbate metabolism protein UlaG (beta-lactamase superfamily)
VDFYHLYEKRNITMKKLMILFIGYFLVSCATSREDIRASSPNFKDGIFNNTHSVEKHSFWKILWTGLTSDIQRATWPEWVESQSDDIPLAIVNGSDVRITFVNHATFLIQAGGLNILTDPVFSERTSPFSFIGPKRIHAPGINLEKLPTIDAIIISHDHYDHLDLDSINKLVKRDNPKLFMGLGVSERLDDAHNATELDWWENVKVSDNLELWFLEVQHFSGRTLTDRDSTLWGGFLLQLEGKNIYFGGDSGYADHYKRTYERFGPMDIAFLPIGAYAPRNMFKPVHLDPSDAVQAHIDLKSKLSIGMHYGSFQLSAESRTEPVELLEKAKQKANLVDSDFIVLEVGKPFNLTEYQSTK